MKNLLLKIGVVLILAMIICAIYIQETQAVEDGFSFGISPARTDYTQTTSPKDEYVYTFEATGGLRYIWNVQQYVNSAPVDGKTFYCLSEGYGDFGNFPAPAEKNEVPTATGGISSKSYKGPFNLKETEMALTTVKSIYNNTEVKAFDADRINGLVWILDNMYIQGENKTNFLNKIPCLKEDGTPRMITNPDGTTEVYTLGKMMEDYIGTDAEISNTDIEVIQQLAIWHITNEDKVGSFPAIYLTKKEGTSFGQLKQYSLIYTQEDQDVNKTYGQLREYFLKMVYNYFEKGATTAQAEGYSITTDPKTIISVYANAEAQPVVTITREQEITGKYNVILKKVGLNNTPLTGAVFTINGTNYTTGEDGTVIIAKDVQITETNVGTQDKYEITETTAPNGYAKYDQKITATITKTTTADGRRYIINNATLDSTSTASGKVTITKDVEAGIITITVVDEIEEKEYIDLALRKFISKVVGADGKEVYSSTELENRIPDPDTTNLKNGSGKTTAEYGHTKKPLKVSVGDKVTYTLRVYNEGNTNAYITQITDYLSKYLKYQENTEWLRTYGTDNTNEETGETSLKRYESKATSTTLTKITGSSDNLSTLVGKSIGDGVLIPAYDKVNDKLSYIDVQITCEVLNPQALPKEEADTVEGIAETEETKKTEEIEDYKMTNIAEITGMLDKNGNVVKKDIDSTPGNLEPLEGVESLEGIELPETEQKWQEYKDELISKKDYIPGQEDDDDFEKVFIGGNFDLALRKFITKINTKSVNNRYPQASIDENGKIKYTHTKDPLEVCTGDIVTYTIRIYNEGEIDGYANEITDDVPFGLEFIADNPTNKEYRWVMLDEKENETTDVTKAKYIVTDYLSETQERETGRTNLIKAFNKETAITDKNPDYKEVQIAFKVAYQVKEVGEESRILVNVAQISADSNDDIDSTPNRDEVYNDKRHEDDIDYENVKVKYFDLSLLKWVTRAVVVENGETRVIQSGHTGYENPEPDLKVELKTKDVKKVIVKFAYTIKITNEGEIAGYAKEITDHIPAGLEFKQEDNPDWYVRKDGVVATAQLENTLLQPGESAEVEIILTWINGEKNLGRKVNIAEISKDYNTSNIPDIDSTPDNEVPGEDDIDDAPVLLVIKTGVETYTQYMSLTTTVIVILGIGIIGIKKFAL